MGLAYVYTMKTIKDMTDQELVDARKALPKYLNYCTDAQRAESAALYAEQKQRYDEKKNADTAVEKKQVDAAGFKAGDRVNYFARSFLGLGGMLVTGTIGKRKKFYVKLDQPFNGKTTAHLTSAWKKVA